MSQYVYQLISLALIHFFAVLSPGPDLAIVIKNSVHEGRRAGLLTSIGIGVGVAVHVMYALLGVGLFLSNHPTYLSVIKYFGVCYLLYLGVNLIFSKPKTYQEKNDQQDVISAGKNFAFFKKGFIVNVLNPKATLFFLAIFTSLLSLETPMAIQVMYGFYLCLATMIWFALMSLFFSKKAIRYKFLSIGHWFDRIMGMILIIFSIKIAFFT